MKKILIVSTVSRQFYLFEQGNIEVLKSLGFEIHAAANFSDANERLDALDIIRHHFEIQRSPFSIKNIKAYKQLKEVMKSENFHAIHCHSPMGSVLTRLAARSIGLSPVIYTAHGFHFYKGAPIINWLVYYPIEKHLSKYTDIQITINQEDYKRAKRLASKKVKYVPGIGIDAIGFNKFSVSNREKKRQELNIPKEAIVLLSVGELNKNKNHEVIIKSMREVEDENVFYIICGKGDKEEYLKKLVNSLDLIDKVKFLGFRNDIPEINIASDIFAFPSFREGLSVSLMEAMAAGLPVICSNIRGNVDLIENDKGGYLINPKDVGGFAKAINELSSNRNKRNSFGAYNLKKVTMFEKENVMKEMSKLYSEVSAHVSKQ